MNNLITSESNAEGISFKERITFSGVPWPDTCACFFGFAVENWVASLCRLFLTYFYAILSNLVSYITITCAVLKSPNVQFNAPQSN